LAKILIIDDEKAVLNDLRLMLEREGYEVITASNGVEGINRFPEYRDIDVVVSRMMMSEVTGLDVLRAVKQQDPDMGVILLTNSGDTENAHKAMEEGVYDCLYRPVDTARLIFSIKNAIRQVSLIRENRRLSEDLCRKDQYLHYINAHAAQILLNMVPKELPDFDAVEVSAIYKSCECVGGDMYDIFDLGGRTFFYLFDVCGHGILSAVMTIILKNAFDGVRTLFKKTGVIQELPEMVKTINDDMYKSSASSLFATLFVGIYDRDERALTYISAGHVDQYLVGDNGIRTLSSNGTVIGLFDNVCFYSEKVTVCPTDRLYLFTDGIIEIWRDECMLNCDDIVDVVKRKHHKPLEESVNSIYENIICLYNDMEPEDDITIVGLEFKEGGRGVNAD
jgi:sigma-B regulation protein RsbU (phosphoserine phosphatase)